jgi:hypothetical protein
MNIIFNKNTKKKKTAHQPLWLKLVKKKRNPWIAFLILNQEMI